MMMHGLTNVELVTNCSVKYGYVVCVGVCVCV